VSRHVGYDAEVSPFDPAPFRRIASELREAIRRGVYGPGDELPTAAELAERWHVTRGTTQHAYELLRTEGLVDTGQGRPPRVRTAVEPRRRRLSRTRYGRARREQCRLTRAPQQITFAGRAPAPRQVADIFGLETGTLMVSRRRTIYGARAGEGPVEIGESWLRLDEFGGTELEEPHLLDPSLFAVAERVSGRTYTRARELWTAELATDDQARALRISPRAALLHVVHIAMDGRRQPIEVSQSWWPNIVLEDEFRIDRAEAAADVSDL
jgi:GntR family transcriptional regulator